MEKAPNRNPTDFLGPCFNGIIATDTDHVRVHLYGFTEVCGLGQSKGCTVATDFFPLMCMDYVLHVNFVYSLSILIYSFS